MPQFQGQPVTTKEYIEDLKSADLNFDGVEDEYFMVNKRVVRFCGELPEEAVDQIIKSNYGKYEKMTKNENGATFYGKNWRATYKFEEGTTLIVARAAIPAFAEGVATSFKVTHLGKSVRIGDPVRLKDGKDYFITGIDLSEATKWDGKKMTIDDKKVKLALVSKQGVMKLRDQKPIKKEEMKVVKLGEIKAVKSREEFPEVYAQK